MADHRTRADKLRDMAAKGTPPERAIAMTKLKAMGEPLTPPVGQPFRRPWVRTSASNSTNGMPFTDDALKRAYENVVRGFSPFTYNENGERVWPTEAYRVSNSEFEGAVRRARDEARAAADRMRRATDDAEARVAYQRFDAEMSRAREKARADQRAQQAAYRAERDAQKVERERYDLGRLWRQAGVRPGGGTQTFEMDPDTGDFAPADGPRTRQPFDSDGFGSSGNPRFQVEYSAQSGQPIGVKRKW